MDNNNSIKNLPKGYLEKRKKTTIFFICTVYAFCLILVLDHFNISNIIDRKIIGIIGGIIAISNILSMIYAYKCKKVYDDIEILNYKEISAFSIKEKLLYALPLLIVVCFTSFKIVGYFVFLGLEYIGIDMFDRPYDPNDPLDPINFKR